MVDFRGLETLVWVAALGSFRKAADRLGATQPAISHRITQLEEQVGAKLLVRDMRVITPTSQGRELLVYAEKLLALRTEMLAHVRDKSAVRGIVRLGAAESIVQTWLPDFIKQVDRIYPQLSVEIEVDISLNLQAKLMDQEIDIAFLQGPISGPRISNRLLCEYPIRFIASPILNLPNPASITDLAQYPIITFSRKTQPYEMVKALFSTPGSPRVRIHASASMATAVRLALEAIGVAAIPADLVHQELAARKLEIVQCEQTLPPLSFFASWIAAPETYEVGLVADIAARTAAKWSSEINAPT